MAKLKSEFKKVLLSKRQEFNQKYYLAKLNYPSLDSDVFSQSLERILDLLPNEIPDILISSESFVLFTEICYSKVLEMLGKNFLGSNTTRPEFVERWMKFLQVSGVAVFSDPEFFFQSFPNSLLNLEKKQNFLLNSWLQDLTLFIQKGYKGNSLLKLGYLSAWKNGMALYRESALDYMKDFQVEEINFLFNLHLKEEDKSGFLFYLQENPWRQPEHFHKTNKDYIVTSRIAGGFIGLGGEFYFPPKFLEGHPEVVTDGVNLFYIHADCYGVNLEKISQEDIPKVSSKNPLPVKRSLDGIQISGKIYETLPFPKEVTIKTNYQSFFIVSPYSHSLLVGGIYK